MRRGVIVAATSAYAIASATAKDLPAYIDNALAKAKARLAKSELRAQSILRNTQTPQTRRDAQAFLHLDYAREARALQSLTELVGESSDKELSKALATLREEETLAMNSLPVTSAERVAASRPEELKIPERNMAIRGPVNFYRPEYGRWWLADKTKDEHFDSKIPLARRGHYVMYEALNFVDGRRTVADIRDLVSDEFEPIPVEEFANYFDFLASVGVVTMKGGVPLH